MRVAAISLTHANNISAGNWRGDGVVINTTNSDNYKAIDPDLVMLNMGPLAHLRFTEFWRQVKAY